VVTCVCATSITEDGHDTVQSCNAIGAYEMPDTVTPMTDTRRFTLTAVPA
jgi:hypothetical protein